MKNLHGISLTIIIVISGLLIIANYYTIRTTSAIRAYINGESYYSKGNKDASKDLILFVVSEDDAHYQSFLDNIKIPIGDSIARVAMDSNGSLEVIRKGLIQGNNHPDDLDNLIWLFQNFRNVIFMDSIIKVWKEADALVGELYNEGQSFHDEIKQRPLSVEKKKSVISKVNTLYLELTEKGVEFAGVLGDSSRKISTYLFYVNVVLILLIVSSVGGYILIFIKKLSDSNELRNQIMNSSFDAVIWYNTNSEIVYWNHQAENIFGWEKEVAIGKSLTELIIPDRFHDRHKDTIKQYLENGENAKSNNAVETIALNRSGAELPIELTIIPIIQNDNTLFCAHIRDITERKEMEKGLREREIFLHGILESTNDGIMATDPDGNIINSNTRFKEIWQISDEMYEKNDINEIMPYVLSQILFPNEFVEKIQTLFKSDKIDVDLLEFKNGNKIHRFSSPLILHDEIVGRVWSFRDVTKEKNAETALIEAEERYRNIFENATEGIYIASTQGRFITVNPAMVKMFGYNSPDDMVSSITRIGETLYVEQEDRINSRNILKKEGKAFGLEFKVRKKDGEIFWVRNHLRVVHDDLGNPLHIEGSVEDITDRKLAEAKLMTQLEEVKKVNYELDKFVYSVSHDLRAPLSSILGVVNIAETENPSPVLKEYLGLIKGSVSRLDHFIKDILDYSRNSRMKIEIVKIDFNQITSEAKLNLNFMEGYGRITFNIEIDIEGSFYSDKRSVEVILNNLISNSIKYQDYKKESSFISISIRASEKQVVIEFSDNGVGIEQDYIDKVFDMFFRASKEFSGAGLGLYILKETVGKLNGSVKLESKKGEFTKFEITLPSLEGQRSKLFIS
ncbi:PAS domain S-box protein [Reichenbachiella sp. MALMAid0571]|uniref:PAS domain-containing sensor histidine kinase n=1 Tax=Reichenbachiella sp. MALMAid0571 TaxID=3143939 RepID=UPI0032DEFB09